MRRALPGNQLPVFDQNIGRDRLASGVLMLRKFSCAYLFRLITVRRFSQRERYERLGVNKRDELRKVDLSTEPLCVRPTGHIGKFSLRIW